MAQWLKLALSAFLAGGVAMLFGQAGQWERPQMDAADAWPRGMRLPGSATSGDRHTLDEQIEQQSNLVRTREASPYSTVVSVSDLAHRVPRKAMSEFEKATNARKKGDLDKSIEHLVKAVSIDPEFYDAVNNLGVNYLRTKQVQLAIEQFNKAIQIGPHKPFAYTNLSLGFLMQGHWQDAERAARRALDFDRGGTRGPFILGCALVIQEKFTTEAEQNLRKAAPDYPQATLLLAPVLAAKGDIPSAKDHLQRYLASGDPTGVKIANQWMQQLDRAARK